MGHVGSSKGRGLRKSHATPVPAPVPLLRPPQATCSVPDQPTPRLHQSTIALATASCSAAKWTQAANASETQKVNRGIHCLFGQKKKKKKKKKGGAPFFLAKKKKKKKKKK